MEGNGRAELVVTVAVVLSPTVVVQEMAEVDCS